MILLDFGPSDRETRDCAPRGANLVRGMTDRPQPDRDPPAEVLAKAAVSAAIATKDAVDAELFNSVRVGLMLSSGRPGVKKLMFVLTDRTNPKRKTECSLSTTVDKDQLALVTDCMGKTREVGRVAIADPGAREAVRGAVEKFLFDLTDRFARPAAG